jgi:[protein-PII] uridylyltransferase
MALRSDDEPLPRALDTLPVREQAFRVAPRVLIADKASTRTTVVEVNARDRPGLLARLAQVIHAAGHELHSAHIATYGERAVDVFYLTDSAGRKLGDEAIQQLRGELLEVAASAG